MFVVSEYKLPIDMSVPTPSPMGCSLAKRIASAAATSSPIPRTAFGEAAFGFVCTFLAYDKGDRQNLILILVI
jgi:hypothetical protein